MARNCSYYNQSTESPTLSQQLAPCQGAWCRSWSEVPISRLRVTPGHDHYCPPAHASKQPASTVPVGSGYNAQAL